MGAALGLVIYAAVKPIFKIYFIIAMGYYLARRNILTVSTCRDISDLIVTAIMPCLIFYNIVSYLVSSDVKYIGIVFFEGTLLFIVGALLALLTLVVCNLPKAWLGGLLSVGLFPNISDLPIAYLQTLGKTGSLFSTADADKGVAYVCIFLATQIFYQFSMGLYQLVRWDFREQLADPERTAEALPAPDATPALSAAPSYRPAPSLSADKESTHLLSSNELIDSVAPDAESDQHAEFLQQLESHATTPLSLALAQDSAAPLRRRRMSTASAATNYYSLNPQTLRSVELRHMRSQDIDDVIHEYSEFDRLRSHEVRRTVTLQSECGVEDIVPEEPPATTGQRIRAHVVAALKNFRAPNSVSLIVSLAIAMAPPLRALFVEGSFYMPDAPDKKPPLSFMIDLASYVGAASVPLGLLLLGATIARLKVNQMVPGFWKTAVMITACRLVVLPIFGVGLTKGLAHAGWFGDDKLIQFVSVLEFGLPNATALVYFTAFYTDPASPDHLQMDCLAVCLIAQYLVLFITLPILVTYTLKVSLGF